MLGYRNGQPIVVCDGCYEPIGPATIIEDSGAPHHGHLIASGRDYAAFNGCTTPLGARWQRADGRTGDIHDNDRCSALLDAQAPITRATPTSTTEASR